MKLEVYWEKATLQRYMKQRSTSHHRNMLQRQQIRKFYQITKEIWQIFIINYTDQQALLQEVNLLRKLEHENIIQLHEVFESRNNIHLVLEQLNGGELFERIKQKGTYNEKDASIIMSCILKALVAMHKQNIVHRDLKPENLLFKNDAIESLKIVDFGLSASLKDGLLYMRCGSPGYVAPEILLDNGYGVKADLFSAGIILYILLTGKFVFSGKCYKEILSKNKDCIIPFPPQYWSQLTMEAKDLVQQMLQKNPEHRISAIEALQHPWFQMNGTNLQLLNLDFEIADVPLTDEEPSLSKSVNVSLITTSPIWNKSRMREYIKQVNQEQDKMNTFQTPLPNPKLIGSFLRRNQNPQQQKLSSGLVMQNLFQQTQKGKNNKQNSGIKSSQNDQFNTTKQIKSMTPSIQSNNDRHISTAQVLLNKLFSFTKNDNKQKVQQNPQVTTTITKRNFEEDKQDQRQQALSKWIPNSDNKVFLSKVVEDLVQEDLRSFNVQNIESIRRNDSYVNRVSKNGVSSQSPVQPQNPSEQVDTIEQDEIEENTGFDQKDLVVEFNVHSSYYLMKSNQSSSNQNQSYSHHQISNDSLNNQHRVSAIHANSPGKRILDNNINNIKPNNISNGSIFSGSIQPCAISGQGGFTDSQGNVNLNLQSNIIPHRQDQEKIPSSAQKNDAIDIQNNVGEELSVDIDEQGCIGLCRAPRATPGSLYGGSRNIMRNQIQFQRGPLIKYLTFANNSDQENKVHVEKNEESKHSKRKLICSKFKNVIQIEELSSQSEKEQDLKQTERSDAIKRPIAQEHPVIVFGEDQNNMFQQQNRYSINQQYLQQSQQLQPASSDEQFHTAIQSLNDIQDKKNNVTQTYPLIQVVLSQGQIKESMYQSYSQDPSQTNLENIQPKYSFLSIENRSFTKDRKSSAKENQQRKASNRVNNLRKQLIGQI